ncbi:hypothetical protein BJ166DRAFT_325752 [Pestalotiopsis sp. NC0098]|nr:hypothetical protein BJ166DRAFT_325752 [Pestalotiopsis sp. NC0098]
MRSNYASDWRRTRCISYITSAQQQQPKPQSVSFCMALFVTTLLQHREDRQRSPQQETATAPRNLRDEANNILSRRPVTRSRLQGETGEQFVGPRSSRRHLPINLLATLTDVLICRAPSCGMSHRTPLSDVYFIYFLFSEFFFSPRRRTLYRLSLKSRSTRLTAPNAHEASIHSCLTTGSGRRLVQSKRERSKCLDCFLGMIHYRLFVCRSSICHSGNHIVTEWDQRKKPTALHNSGICNSRFCMTSCRLITFG